eukprot:m.65987 g.65987  ORF g.65987 m.65987 type:complete len:624 (-) comp11776_c0_seq1:56-1927(-)
MNEGKSKEDVTQELEEFRRKWAIEVERKRKLEFHEQRHGQRPVAPRRASKPLPVSAVSRGQQEQFIIPPHLLIREINREEEEDKINEISNQITQDNDGQEDFVGLLIDDLNELNEIPLFDVKLPVEVAIRILQHLDMVSLARCSQTCKDWNQLASDTQIWHRIAIKNQYPVCERREGEHWKDFCKRHVLHTRMLDERWRTMTAAFTQVKSGTLGRGDDVEVRSILRVLDSNADYVLAGYDNGQVNLINLDEDLTMVRVPSSQACDGRNIVSLACGKNFAVVESADNRIHIIDVSTGNILQTFWAVQDGNILDVGRTYHGPIAVNDKLPSVMWGNNESGDIQGFSALRSGEWERVWKECYTESGKMQDIQMTQGDAFVYQTHISVGMASVQTGRNVATLHSDELADWCSCLEVGTENIFYVREDSVTSARAIVVCRQDTGLQAQVIECPRIRPVSVHNPPDNPNLIFTSGTGLQIYDLRTNKMAKRLYSGSKRVHTARCEGWKVVCGQADGALQQTTVWDLRSHKQLWYIRSPQAVKHVNIVKDFLIYGSASKMSDLVNRDMNNMDILVPQRVSSLNILDFAAKPSALADATCPFASTFDDVAGYRYNDHLAVVYDDINPYQFG